MVKTTKPPDPSMARRYWAFLLRRNLPHDAVSIAAFFVSWDWKKA